MKRKEAFDQESDLFSLPGMTRIAQVRLSIPQLEWVGAQYPFIMRV